MALLDVNAVAIQDNYYPLLTLSLLILAGNTCFPPFLRLILWTMKKALPKSSSSPRMQKWRTVLIFILDHPRRVYTNLFPAAQTWWLVLSLVCLNGADWIFFEILNIGNPATDVIPTRYRVLDGLFQAFAVRSGGFYVVDISQLRSGLLVLYVLMMYVSALPVTMTIRNTNVYEERSLGVFSEDQQEERKEQPELPQSSTLMGNLKRQFTSSPGNQFRPHPAQMAYWNRGDFIRQQLRGQLGHDLWWIALAVFLITIIETGQFERNPVVFATFNIIFEVVSAYGTVGISTGGKQNSYRCSALKVTDGCSTLECIQFLWRMAQREQAGSLCRHASGETPRPSSGDRQGGVAATRDAGMGGGRGRAEEEPDKEEVGIGG
jgi:Trk-type K+ transport system membrane component